MESKPKISRLRKLFRLVLVGLLLMSALVFGSNWWVAHSAKDKIFDSVETIPPNKVGLLLGTGKYVQGGRINLYYKFRMEAARDLYKAGKIEFVLVSGDNGSKNYDETTSMQEDLIALGIPEDKIFMDYAGFRTLDSIVRAREIFGQTKFTVISQKFHNERAVYIASAKDMNVIGYNARDIGGRYGFKMQQREKLARTKMVLDLIFGTDPRYLGEPVEIK